MISEARIIEVVKFAMQEVLNEREEKLNARFEAVAEMLIDVYPPIHVESNAQRLIKKIRGEESTCTVRERNEPETKA